MVTVGLVTCGCSGLHMVIVGYLCYIGLQWVTVSYIWLQMVTVGYISLQWVTYDYCGLHMVTVR